MTDSELLDLISTNAVELYNFHFNYDSKRWHWWDRTHYVPRWKEAASFREAFELHIAAEKARAKEEMTKK